MNDTIVKTENGFYVIPEKVSLDENTNKNTLEYQLQEFLGIDPKPLSDKAKKFYRLSIEDCLNFTEKAINDKLKEYGKEQLAVNQNKTK